MRSRSMMCICQHCLELNQQGLRRSEIAAVVPQFSYDLSLTRNVILALRDMPLSERKMPFQHRSVH